MQLLCLLSPHLVDFPHHFLGLALLGAEVGQLEVDLGQLLVVVGELAEHLVPLLLVHLQLPEDLLIRLAQLLVGDRNLGDLARFLDCLLVQSLLLLAQLVLPSLPLLGLLLRQLLCLSLYDLDLVHFAVNLLLIECFHFFDSHFNSFIALLINFGDVALSLLDLLLELLDLLHQQSRPLLEFSFVRFQALHFRL